MAPQRKWAIGEEDEMGFAAIIVHEDGTRERLPGVFVTRAEAAAHARREINERENQDAKN